MAEPSSSVRPNIQYRDMDETRHRLWEATLDPGRDCSCREGQTYPDFIVRAIDLERTSFATESVEMQTELEYLHECLQSAYKEIERQEQRLEKRDQSIMACK